VTWESHSRKRFLRLLLCSGLNCVVVSSSFLTSVSSIQRLVNHFRTLSSSSGMVCFAQIIWSVFLPYFLFNSKLYRSLRGLCRSSGKSFDYQCWHFPPRWLLHECGGHRRDYHHIPWLLHRPHGSYSYDGPQKRGEKLEWVWLWWLKMPIETDFMIDKLCPLQERSHTLASSFLTRPGMTRYSLYLPIMVLHSREYLIVRMGFLPRQVMPVSWGKRSWRVSAFHESSRLPVA